MLNDKWRKQGEALNLIWVKWKSEPVSSEYKLNESGGDCMRNSNCLYDHVRDRWGVSSDVLLHAKIKKNIMRGGIWFVVGGYERGIAKVAKLFIKTECVRTVIYRIQLYRNNC